MTSNVDTCEMEQIPMLDYLLDRTKQLERCMTNAMADLPESKFHADWTKTNDNGKLFSGAVVIRYAILPKLKQATSIFKEISRSSLSGLFVSPITSASGHTFWHNLLKGLAIWYHYIAHGMSLDNIDNCKFSTKHHVNNFQPMTILWGTQYWFHLRGLQIRAAY